MSKKVIIFVGYMVFSFCGTLYATGVVGDGKGVSASSSGSRDMLSENGSCKQSRSLGIHLIDVNNSLEFSQNTTEKSVK